MQLTLNLAPPPAPTLDNFVPGANAEALAAVRALRTPRPGQTRFLYLWGLTGSGRTHLLHALADAAPDPDSLHPIASRLLTPASPENDFVYDPAIRRWLIDDCDRLDAARQAATFHLFQAVQACPDAVLAAAGQQAPAHLQVMPELATRLGWGLVLQLKPLSDADTATALARTLSERGLSCSPEVIPWLMTHGPRNLGHLRALIDALDAFALARKRAITLPLLREFAQQRPSTEPGQAGNMP